MNKNIFSNKFMVIVLAVIVSMLWGTLFPSIKLGYKAFGIDSNNVASILLFAGVRFFVSGILLVLFVKRKKTSKASFDSRKIKYIVIVSFLTVILHYALTYIGLSLADSSKSSVLKQIAFLVLPCFVFLFNKEDKFSINKVIAAIIGFLSVIIINLNGMDLVFGIGEFMIIAASFSSMSGQLVSKNAYKQYAPSEIVAYSQLFGGLVLCIVGLIFGGRLDQIGLNSVLVLTYICFASILANLLWNTLIKYNDMSKLAVLKSMDPLFASAFSAILLQENILKPTYIIATFLTVFAIIISNLRPSIKNKI